MFYIYNMDYIPLNKSFQDLTGQTFGLLKVRYYAGSMKRPSGRRLFYYFCLCQCGNTKIIEADSLRTGNTQSCGCLKPVYRKQSSRKSKVKPKVRSVARLKMDIFLEEVRKRNERNSLE